MSHEADRGDRGSDEHTEDRGGDDLTDDRASVETHDPGFWRRVGLGLRSGLIATVVMTLFRMPISNSPPPTANFWAKFVAGGEPEDHTLIGLVLHFIYGMGGGLLFTMFSPAPRGPDVEQERTGIFVGVLFGLLMSGFGLRFVLGTFLDMELDSDEKFVFHVSHVVYGLTLGAWYGSKVD